jgi:hypothetical protein
MSTRGVCLTSRRWAQGLVVWTSLGPLPQWDQDRLLRGPLGLPDLRSTAPASVKHKDYRGEVLG